MNLTYEQLIEFAMKNYNKGGDVIVECWDQREYNEYVQEFGPITKGKARNLMNLYDEQFREQQAMMSW